MLRFPEGSALFGAVFRIYMAIYSKTLRKVLQESTDQRNILLPVSMGLIVGTL